MIQQLHFTNLKLNQERIKDLLVAGIPESQLKTFENTSTELTNEKTQREIYRLFPF